MPGGRLVVSSNGTTPGTAVVWGVYPVNGNANTRVVHGALVAYEVVRFREARARVRAAEA